MAIKQIVIEIDPTGAVKIDALGFQGKGCAAATEAIEISIGGMAPKEKKQKPEFFSPASTGTKTNTRTF